MARGPRGPGGGGLAAQRPGSPGCGGPHGAVGAAGRPGAGLLARAERRRLPRDPRPGAGPAAPHGGRLPALRSGPPAAGAADSRRSGPLRQGVRGRAGGEPAGRGRFHGLHRPAGAAQKRERAGRRRPRPGPEGLLRRAPRRPERAGAGGPQPRRLALQRLRRDLRGAERPYRKPGRPALRGRGPVPRPGGRRPGGAKRQGRRRDPAGHHDAGAPGSAGRVRRHRRLLAGVPPGAEQDPGLPVSSRRTPRRQPPTRRPGPRSRSRPRPGTSAIW